MARGKVDRRSFSGHVDWEELLSDHSSLHSCQGVVRRSLERRDEEQQQRKCRKLEHVQGTVSQIINAATSEQLRSWIQYGSWAKCLQCNALHRSKLSMDRFHVTRPWSNTLNACYFCSTGIYVPHAYDFPSPLLHLTREVVNALRPLTLFQGKPTWGKHGFRRHSEMTKLKWSPLSVEEKIRALESPWRESAYRAFNFLMDSSRSSYRDYVQEHRDILTKGTAGQWLPHKVMLRRYLECVLWPGLYPSRAVCDTEFAGSLRGKKKSVKQAFLAKVVSPVYDFALQYDLLHFHFDRHVMSSFSGKARAAGPLSLMRALKDFPDSPHDRRLNSLAMTDLNHTLGRAKFMITLAPGAYATTWPEVVLHCRDVTKARTLGDNALEALHIVHILDQLCRGFLFNTNHTRRRKGNEFAVFDSVHCESAVLAWAYRLEFQEGEHKARPGYAHRLYHGTGMPHVHAAVWMRSNVNVSNVLKWVRADLATDFPALEAAVTRIQAPNAEEPPRLPVVESSHWDGDEPRFRHSIQDEESGVHPYIVPLCLAHICHSHVSEVRDQGHVTQYMSKIGKYMTKSNQALPDSWLRDAQSGFGAAVKFLRTTHPSSAEMLNVLSSGSTFYLSCARKEVAVCAPNERESSAFKHFGHYLDMRSQGTFAEFLRTHNTSVTPPAPYRRLRGALVALAIETCSPWNDYYYAQWLTMHHVWNGEVALPLDEMGLVPPRHKWFSACLLMDPDFWIDAGKVALWFGADGMSKTRLQTLTSMHSCWRQYVERFLRGDVIYVEPVRTREELLPLTCEQQRAYDEILDRYRALQNDPDAGNAVRVRGEAGTGKSRVLDEFLCAAKDAQENDDEELAMPRTVLMMTPTGVLSDVYRRRWKDADNIQVDTFDGAMDTLQMFELTEFNVSQFDAWVVDECEYLTPTQWRRLITLSHACPAVFKLLAGDPRQFRPREDDGGQTASHFQCVTITLRTQMRFDPSTPWGRACLHVRSARATVEDVDTFVGQRLLCYDPPTTITMRAFFDIFPKGLAVAVSLESVSVLNNLALEALMVDEDYLGQIFIDAKGDVAPMHIYRSARVMVTDNLMKSEGVVNGAFGIVLSLSRDCLVVLLDNGIEAAIHKVAFERPHGGYYVAFPVTHGYACTLAKMQGHTVTNGLAVWPDCSVPAAGYVAVTRVRAPEQLLWIQRPTPEFFIPAD